MPHCLVQALNNPQNYLTQISRLQEKLDSQYRSNDVAQEGVNFYQFVLHAPQVAKCIIKTLQDEKYTFRVAKPQFIRQEKKIRVVYPLPITDYLVQSIVGQTLSSHLADWVIENVHSYIKGRSPKKAVSLFASYLRAQLATSKQNHQNVYVFRTDVRSYTDTIPVAPHAPMWAILKEYIHNIDPQNTLPDYYWSLIEAALRPTIEQEKNGHFNHFIGLPMGSPLTTIVAVLYLQNMDRRLSEIPGGFYARFGDDLLFAHSDPEIVYQAYELTIHELQSLGLSTHRDKSEMVYLTRPGKASPDSRYQGAATIKYLGFEIYANGSLGLKTESLTKIWNNLRQRIDRTHRLLGDLPLEKQGQVLCASVAQALNMYNSLAVGDTPRFLQNTTNRSQFKQFDYTVALYIAQKLSGRVGVRAFRKIPYKKMRSEWGLSSLCHLKNRKFIKDEA